MKVRKEWIGSNKTATQGNLAELQEDIHIDLAHMEKKFTGMEERMEKKFTTMEERLRRDLMDKETGKDILDIVKSLDKRLATLKDIPERVTTLENDVFKLKLRR